MQVIADLKGSECSWSYQTPPSSPSTTSRKSSMCRCVTSRAPASETRLGHQGWLAYSVLHRKHGLGLICNILYSYRSVNFSYRLSWFYCNLATLHTFVHCFNQDYIYIKYNQVHSPVFEWRRKIVNFPLYTTTMDVNEV